MEICPFCGITSEEQDAQKALAGTQFRLLNMRWKQLNDPKEPHPGLPVTDEHRVHYALFLYENDSSEKPNVSAIAREAGADYQQLLKALDYTKKHRQEV